jgi:heat-inducible transcriptional repressor
VKNFILTANPVASSLIAHSGSLSLSSATIRNIMGQLEEKGYIFQPHTSSGRVPTNVGYRIFVDQMMRKSRLSSEEKEKIRQAININAGVYDEILKESSRILALLSHQLSVIVSPHLGEGIFQRMDINRLGSDRLLLIIYIKSGIVKTIMMEIESDVPAKQLDILAKLLNERLQGLKINEIRTKFKEIVSDISPEKSQLLHLFVDSAEKIFDFSENSDVFLTGTHNIIRQPEFNDFEEISRVVEALEDKNVIIHLLDQNQMMPDINVLIGEEISDSKMKKCSIITARYKIGQVRGTLGIIGPTRMDYSYLIPLVEYTSHALSESVEINLSYKSLT